MILGRRFQIEILSIISRHQLEMAINYGLLALNVKREKVVLGSQSECQGHILFNLWDLMGYYDPIRSVINNQGG